MPMSKGHFRSAAVAALALAVAAAATPAAAQGGNPLNSIVGCDAAGNQQRNGALIGGALGAVAGTVVSKKDTEGAVIGGVLGAAIGSYMGCQKQRQTAQGAPYGEPQYGYGDYERPYQEPYGQSAYEPQYQGGYDRGYQPAYGAGFPLARGVQAAAYTPAEAELVATTNVNLRAGPSTSSAKVGQLRAGERFEALGVTQGSNWVLVGCGGVGVGYVSRAYVRQAEPQYAQGYVR